MNTLFSQDKNQIALPDGKLHVSWFWDWFFGGLFVLGGIPFFLPLALQLTPLRWNVSASLPIGFYWETGRQIARGNYVHFCLEEQIAAFAFARRYIRSGACSGLYEELLKPVAAIAGDTVEISSARHSD